VKILLENNYDERDLSIRNQTINQSVLFQAMRTIETKRTQGRY